jgi:hypothetical protein
MGSFQTEFRPDVIASGHDAGIIVQAARFSNCNQIVRSFSDRVKLW